MNINKCKEVLACMRLESSLHLSPIQQKVITCCSMFLKNLPKKKECPITKVAGVTVDSEQFNYGFNSAISEIEEIIEKS